MKEIFHLDSQATQFLLYFKKDIHNIFPLVRKRVLCFESLSCPIFLMLSSSVKKWLLFISTHIQLQVLASGALPHLNFWKIGLMRPYFRNGGGFRTCIYTAHIKGDAAAAFSWPLALWEITEIGLAWSQTWQWLPTWHGNLPRDDGK